MKLLYVSWFYISYDTLTILQASLQSERDQLLTEKSTWSKQTASAPEPAVSAAPENWEAES